MRNLNKRRCRDRRRRVGETTTKKKRVRGPESFKSTNAVKVETGKG